MVCPNTYPTRLKHTAQIAAAMALDLGVIGVTLALAAITILGQVFYFWPLHMRWGVFGVGRFARETLGPGIAPALIGASVWGAAAAFYEIDSWIDLFIAGVPGGVAYLAALFVVLDGKEKGDLKAVARKFSKV